VPTSPEVCAYTTLGISKCRIGTDTLFETRCNASTLKDTYYYKNTTHIKMQNNVTPKQQS